MWALLVAGATCEGVLVLPHYELVTATRRFGGVHLTRRLLIGAAVAVLVATAPAAPALATPTVIRVGGPSDPAESKVAIVASDRNLKGARSG